MKKKILVFPCGSEIGLEIYNSLKWSAHIELWGGSSVSDHGKFVYKNYIGSLPFIDDKKFIDKLTLIINKYKIDYIFPAHDSVVLRLAENVKRLGCRVIGSELKTCQICRSKKKTYEYFENKLRVPRMHQHNDASIVFPVFLKPDVGQGAKGTSIARSKQDIDFYLSKDPTLLILEYLPGEEYTIDCFTDRKGALLFVGSRERSRINNGISVNTKNISDAKFTRIANQINKSINLRGAWFFQVKKNKNSELVLMEIAPRIAGSMGLYRNFGVNFSLLSVYDAMGLDVEISPNNYSGEMDRALTNRFELNLSFSHVYIDLDDTIIFNEKINPWVVSFLHQCFNKKIRMHLLTRHKARFGENVEKVLLRYRIHGLFDTITDIPDGKEKSSYIKERQSIFIDDSFSERKNVSKKRKIPVFEVSSIESLIDWKY
ncbi:MAG TPA: ATP-grasp domain-containing protein [Candidatus Kapabacteria bacterium]|nr:ATP-grasp domain-containing protein [Candidatus Kapabacteria bacterium]